MTLGDGAGFVPPGERALVQETLDLRSMVEGEARSFMGGAGAATTTATNRETRSSTLENMTMD
jgi:hypothetical protein